MKVRLLVPLALSATALVACGHTGTPGSTPGATNADGGNASGDFCTIAQKVVNDQQGVADAIRAITLNTVSGPDMATPAGWAQRQTLATDAVNVAQSLIADYAAGDPLITDPAVVTSWDQMSQFYSDSVLAANQAVLAAPDEATYTTTNTGGSLTVAPTAAQIAVQTYITGQCGFLSPAR